MLIRKMHPQCWQHHIKCGRMAVPEIRRIMERRSSCREEENGGSCTVRMAAEFAERFIMARQERNFTQQGIAKRLGVTPQAVSKWETGASLPDTEMLKSIAILLDCSMDYLMGHQVTEKNQANLESLERRAEIEKVMQKEILELRVGIGLVGMLEEEGKGGYQLIHGLRLQIAMRYGILVPVIRLMDDIKLQEKEYRIMLHGKVLAAAGLVEYPLYFYLGETANSQEEIEAAEPIWKKKGVWKPAGTAKEDVSKKDVPKPVSAMQMVLYHIEQVILKHYDFILNRQMVADMVEMARRKYPAVTEGVVPEKVPYSLLQQVIAAVVKKGRGIGSMVLLIQMLEDKIDAAACRPLSGQGGRWNAEELAEEFCNMMPETLQ